MASSKGVRPLFKWLFWLTILFLPLLALLD